MFEVTNTTTGVKYFVTSQGHLFRADGIKFVGGFQTVDAAVKVALGQ